MMIYNTKRIVKFLVVGIINTAINLAVLNFLILITSKGRMGLWFAVFQAIGFILATVNSYLMNKHWTFEHQKDKSASEYSIFFFISFIGLLLNVGAASLFINTVHRYFVMTNLEIKLMPSVASLFGTVVSWFWNYNGYKRIFHKKI